MKKSILYYVVAIVVLLGLVLACAPAPAPAPKPAPTPTPTPAPKIDTVTLRGMSNFPANDPTSVLAIKIWDDVTKASNGAIKFENKGGPEAINARDQAEALRKGTIDIVATTGSNISPVVPESLCLFISGKNGEEYRKNGFFDVYNTYFAKNGVQFTCYIGDGLKFSIFTKKTGIKRPQDLKGLVLRSNANYDPFFKALGATTLSLATTEIYSALQTGVIDGYGNPTAAVPATGLVELTKGYIQHWLWNGNPLMAMNLATWNKMSSDTQKLFNDVMIKSEEYARKYWLDETYKAEAELKKAGCEFVKFSAEDLKYYEDLATSTSWEGFLKGNPVSGPLLKTAAYK